MQKKKEEKETKMLLRCIQVFPDAVHIEEHRGLVFHLEKASAINNFMNHEDLGLLFVYKM